MSPETEAGKMPVAKEEAERICRNHGTSDGTYVCCGRRVLTPEIADIQRRTLLAAAKKVSNIGSPASANLLKRLADSLG
jgi:hypothetical protein